jgi:hypothetical protein
MVRFLTVLFLDCDEACDGDVARHDVCGEGPDRIIGTRKGRKTI